MTPPVNDHLHLRCLRDTLKRITECVGCQPPYETIDAVYLVHRRSPDRQVFLASCLICFGSGQEAATVHTA